MMKYIYEANIFMITFMAVVMLNSYYELNHKITLELKAPDVVVSYSVKEAKNESDKQSSNMASYWDIVYEIESRSGKSMFTRSLRKKGVKTCRWTKMACGGFQLTKIAIQDIPMCKGNVRQCMIDRLDYNKSLVMAKAYQKRLEELGCKHDVDYLNYACFNQGATGIRYAIESSRTGKKLPRKIRNNFIRNIAGIKKSKARKMSSKKLAKKYINHWENKWSETIASLNIKTVVQ